MVTYYIRDRKDYLKWFSNNCAWFTRNRCDALPFNRLEEAQIVARVLGRLASDGLEVHAEKEQLPSKRGT